jgi:hypothetical protein
VLEVDDRQSQRVFHEDVPASSWTILGPAMTPAVDRERHPAPGPAA